MDREKLGAVQRGGEADGAAKLRVIVSNWDGSQSVTSANSQSFPLVPPLSKCDMSPASTHTQAAVTPGSVCLSVCLSRSVA